MDPLRRALNHALDYDGNLVRKAWPVVSRAAEAIARVTVLLEEPAPAQYDRNGNYEGRVGGTEHRTVGSRAWCYQCGEWCYPETYACPCCEAKIEPDDLRDALLPLESLAGTGETNHPHPHPNARERRTS